MLLPREMKESGRYESLSHNSYESLGHQWTLMTANMSLVHRSGRFDFQVTPIVDIP